MIKEMEYLKRNKWIIFLTCLLMVFTPTVVFARGFHGGGHFGGFHGGGHTTHTFHDDGGTGHTFHDDEGTGHTFHDEDEDGINTHLSDEETDDDTQSFGSRVKDTFNYLIPRSWHNHHSSYYHVSSSTYSDNRDTAIDQIIDWMEDLCIIYFVLSLITLFIPEKIKNRVKDFISNLLSYKDPVKGRHSIKNK